MADPAAEGIMRVMPVGEVPEGTVFLAVDPANGQMRAWIRTDQTLDPLSICGEAFFHCVDKNKHVYLQSHQLVLV